MYTMVNNDNPLNLVIDEISKIPLCETIFYLKDARIRTYTTEELQRVFTAIPEWISEVCIHDASIADIALAFGSLPKLLRSLAFTGSDLNGTTEQVTNDLRAIPDTVRAFALFECIINIPDVTPEERFLVLSAALPRNLTSFHFEDGVNILRHESTLTQAARLFPEGLITFTFSFKSDEAYSPDPGIVSAFAKIYSYIRRDRIHQIKSIDVQTNIAHIIASLPKGQTSLDLRYMKLGYLNIMVLEQIVNALPDELTYLDLRHNNLHLLPEDKLTLFFTALASKKGLRHLLLSFNDIRLLPILIATLIATKNGLQWIELYDEPFYFRDKKIGKLFAALETSPNIIQFVRSNADKDQYLSKEMNELPIKRQIDAQNQLMQQVFNQLFVLVYLSKMDLYFGRANKFKALPTEIVQEIFIYLLTGHGLNATQHCLTELESIISQAAIKALSDYEESKSVVDEWYELQANCKKNKSSCYNINMRISMFLKKINSMTILGQVFEEFMKDEPGFRVDTRYAEPFMKIAPPKRVYPPGRLAIIHLFQKRAQRLSTETKPELINILSHVLSTAPVEQGREEEPARAGPANA